MAKVLGSVQLVADGAPIDLGGGRQRRLLACLLAHRGAVVTTDSLVEAVFDGELSDAAWRTFRTYVARLRRALDAVGVDGAKVIVTAPPGYLVSPDVGLDAIEFERRLAEAQDALRIGDANVALGAVESALGLWAGPAYGEFAGEDWARPEAVRLEEMRVIAREVHAQAMVESGRHDEALAGINALIEAEPLRETPRRLGMLALYRSGRHAEALRAGQQFRALLAEETGLDWSGSMAELERMIIDRDPRLEAAPQGRKLRGYVLAERIEGTDVGVTYRASQPSVGRDVAVTVIPAERADDPEFIRRFEVHAQRIAAIEHPNVVPLYDYWREPGGAYLVTRHLTGGTLAARLRDREIVDEDEARRLILEIAAGLHAAHDRGVVHGRLDADAVRLDDHGRAHLTGFGHDVNIADRHLDVEALGRLIEQLWERIASPTHAHAGPRPDVASVAERAAAPPLSGFGSVADLIEAFTATTTERETSADDSRPTIEGPNPYRGLQPFREADTEVFFGRSDTIDALDENLRRDGVLVVVGASGAGKSSVVAAGLLPRLRESGAFVATMVPGRHPLAELEIALSRVASTTSQDGPDGVDDADRGDSPGRVSQRIATSVPSDGRLVLVVDQLEETLTLSDVGERDRFFDAIVHARVDMGNRLGVVASARADFLGRLLEHPVVGPLVRDHSRLLAPMTADELFDCIVAPAESAGVAVEPELASALVADAVDAPGSLPMLQFALTELYEHRVEGTMTLDVYRRVGGLTALIAHRAEDVYGALTPDECDGARRLFIRLVTLGEGSEDTRRRVDRGELAQVPAVVVDRFGAARLLTFDRDPPTREPTVEIAHEALIRQWPRLRGWIDDDRAGQRVLRHLTESTRAWEAVDRDPAELYRGNRLSTAEEWASDHTDDLTEAELEFLAAGRAARDAEIERERRRRRGLRNLAAVLAVVALLAGAASVVALTQRKRAQDNEHAAEDRAVEAEMHRLLAESRATLDEDPDLPLLLALEAYDRAETLGIEPPGSLMSTMQTALQGSRVVWRTVDGYSRARLAPGGELVLAVTSDASETIVTEAESGLERTRFPSGARAAFVDDETIVAVAPDDPRTMIVVDARTGSERDRVETGVEILDFEVDPTLGRMLVWFNDPERQLNPGYLAARARVYDTASWNLVGTFESDEALFRTSFSPDGRFLAADADEAGGVDTGDVVIWDLDQPGAQPARVPGPVIVVGWTDGGSVLVSSGTEVRDIDPRSGEEIDRRELGDGATPIVADPASGRLVVIRFDEVLEVYEPGAATPSLVDVPDDLGLDGRPVLTPDGSALVLVRQDGDVGVIPLDGDAPMLLSGNSGGFLDVEFDRKGTRVLVGYAKLQDAPPSTASVLWDLTPKGPAPLGNLPLEGTAGGMAGAIDFTPDGTHVAVGEIVDDLARVKVFDVDSADVIEVIERDVGASTDGVPGVGPLWYAEQGVVVHAEADTAVVTRSDGTPIATVDGCLQPLAIDDLARWLLLGPLCDDGPGRVADPMSGDTILELDRVPLWSSFGRASTISEDLVAFQAALFEDGEAHFQDRRVELRRLPDGELLGSLPFTEERTFLWPQFSSDGRYIVIGSVDAGSWVIDVQQVLDGATMEDAVVANPIGDGGATSYGEVADGFVIAGQAEGEVLRFWDLATGIERMTLPVGYHDGSLYVRASPDGRYLYYTDVGAIRRIALDHVELAALARERVQRDLSAAECLRFDIADCAADT